MAQDITQKLIDRLDSPETGNYIVYDRKLRGFGVRITSAGVKSFVLNYRIRGRERRYTIGRCDEWTVTAATKEAERLRGQIANGKDPLQEKLKEYKDAQLQSSCTFADLGREYMEWAERNRRKSTVRNNRSMLDTILLPQFGQRAPAEVTADDLERVHKSLKATPYRANRLLSLASGIFSWALDPKNPERGRRFGVVSNPARGVERFDEDTRETWLSEEQLDNFSRALDSYSEQDAADALRLLILTGAREGEMLGATWKQFNLQQGIWTKLSHHTKQRKPTQTPLSDAALAILRRMVLRENGPYLFPGHQGEAARVTLRRPWVQVCKAAGLVTAECHAGKRRELIRHKPTVRIHDLRHTFASHLVSHGESLHVVGKLLGHTRPETTARYAHLSDKTLRNATNHFGDIMRRSRSS